MAAIATVAEVFEIAARTSLVPVDVAEPSSSLINSIGPQAGNEEIMPSNRA